MMSASTARRMTAPRRLAFVGNDHVRPAAAAAIGLILAPIPASAQTYAVGERVEMHIGAGPRWRPCTVIRNVPSEPVMRLKRPEYRTSDYFQGAGEYVVERRFDSVRKAGSAGAAARPAPPSGVATVPASANGALKAGEYACYGSGSRIMAGMGFKVIGGGQYTDLDGKMGGSYSVSGGRVTFRGGHLAARSGGT